MNKPIRVLHTASGMSSGGVSKMIQQWFYNTNIEEYEFDIASMNCGMIGKDLNARGCKIIIFKPIREIGVLGYYQQFNYLLKNNEYDIIHSHLGLGSFILFLAAIKNGNKVRILHAHTNLFHNDSKTGLRNLFIRVVKKINVMFATHYCACTNEAGEYFFSKRIMRKKNAQIIFNGIEIDKFKFSLEKRNMLRDKYNLDDDTFVVGNIGRLSAQKNQMFLLEIFKELTKLNQNSILWLIGEGEDEEKLRNKCYELEISNNVVFWGAIDEIENLLLCMDVFVMPSIFEGLGIAAIEAQASGLFCLLSDKIPREVDITENVKFLELTEPVDMWAKALLESKQKPRIDNSQDIINSNYDIKTSTCKLLKVYESAMEEKYGYK